jgi:2,3-bisphosphoglycerate-dependent phosphoglycerate mutase
VTARVELAFETHALTIDNERGFATGWLGGSLSRRGRAFAAELGERRANDGIDVVFASDLARAVETAEVAFAGTSIPVALDWRLRELDYGELNGAPVAVIDGERARRIDVRFPGGESYRDAVARVASFLAEIRARRAGQRILVIGHTATRWALDHLVEGIPLEDAVTAPFDWQEGWEYVLEQRTLATGAPT